MNIKLFLLLAIIAVPIGLHFSGIVDFFSFQYLQENKNQLLGFAQSHPYMILALFIPVYITVCALPVPAVALLTVAAGALFGFAQGLVIVSFSSTIGATIAFKMSRYLGQNSVHSLLGNRIKNVDAEFENAGFLYATSMRLLPGIPFFITNAILGLTTIKSSTFYISTQIGMLIMLSILVNAGNNLAKIESLEDVLSPAMMMSLAILALFPVVVRQIAKRI